MTVLWNLYHEFQSCFPISSHILSPSVLSYHYLPLSLLKIFFWRIPLRCSFLLAIRVTQNSDYSCGTSSIMSMSVWWICCTRPSQRSFSGTSWTMTHSWYSKKSLCLTCQVAVGNIWKTSELGILTGMSASSSPTWQPPCIYHRVFNYLYDNSGLEMFLCIHFEREIIRRLQALRYRTLILS